MQTISLKYLFIQKTKFFDISSNGVEQQGNQFSFLCARYFDTGLFYKFLHPNKFLISENAACPLTCL